MVIFAFLIVKVNGAGFTKEISKNQHEMGGVSGKSIVNK